MDPRGYPKFMIEARRNLGAAWVDTDVTRVVRVLHHAGPLPLRDLADDPELEDWPPERIEQAIVTAWSRGLIFIDARDLFVAI
jgi:hypothetical protein